MGIYFRHRLQQFLRTVVDVVVEVKNTVSGRVCYQYIRIFWDTHIIAAVSIRNIILHKHRNTIEFQSVYLDAGVAW